VFLLVFVKSNIQIHSRDSVVTSYSLDGPEFECRQGQEIFSSPKLSRLALRPYKPPSQWLVGFLPEGNAANQTRPLSKSPHDMPRQAQGGGRDIAPTHLQLGS
jgi:hypothetical protein